MRRNFISLLTIFLFSMIYLVSCKSQETIPQGWTTFKSDLGVSVSYPSTYTGRQENNSVFIKSDYTKDNAPLLSVVMEIRKVNDQRESEIDFMIRAGEKIKYQVTKKRNYDIYESVSGEQVYYGIRYITNDKVTFAVWDNLNIYRKEGLLTQEQYDNYKEVFDKILNSISIS